MAVVTRYAKKLDPLHRRPGQRGPTHTRWCPSHTQVNEMIKRGTNQCRRGRKFGVICLTTPPSKRSPLIPVERLAPMRLKGEPTKRSLERWKKGYAR